ncbi:MAG: hypothetical protein L0Y55_02085, partial [Anaerolineales bacterium]|nr:hypothetical protein [Anaerolineales bacterium]
MSDGSGPFDRRALRFYPLASRVNKVEIERDCISPDAAIPALDDAAARVIGEVAERVLAARASGASRMLTFGAHTIKNGLAPVLAALIERGWISHLATNGAGIIHDWEFAFAGASSEDVRANVAEGKFGAWEETGRWINLAIAVGAYSGLGYGASVGRMVSEETLRLPSRHALRVAIADNAQQNPAQSAAAADLLGVMQSMDLAGGDVPLPHPFKRF